MSNYDKNVPLYDKIMPNCETSHATLRNYHAAFAAFSMQKYASIRPI
ncbi:hypothetical protein [Photobacterium phosphoreum]|nr:hypothetical protein [Photobacterium phosphoreum]